MQFSTVVLRHTIACGHVRDTDDSSASRESSDNERERESRLGEMEGVIGKARSESAWDVQQLASLLC